MEDILDEVIKINDFNEKVRVFLASFDNTVEIKTCFKNATEALGIEPT
jgi:hypothetical protein